jgi:hypothetical protein
MLWSPSTVADIMLPRIGFLRALCTDEPKRRARPKKYRIVWCARLCPNSHTARKSVSLSPLEQTGQSRPFKPVIVFIVDLGIANKMERSLVTDLRRDKYVERCKQRFFAYLDQGDLKKAAALFVRDMNVRPDCELPHHLAALGASLLMADDALGWRALIEGLR